MAAYRSIYDRTGIISALVCLVHCIVLPLFFSTLSVWNIELLHHFLIELLTLLISLFVGGWAIWRGYLQQHRKPVIPVLFALGLVMMIAANFVATEAMEVLLKGGGIALIVYAHIGNWWLSRTAHSCNSNA
ncbi:MerC domain-containing protein [Pseudocnuella soli]|uniref:MerC domain-containing protein n=1 Tax=Pseudocnuella soli TaxID=2502779 RepID=UPI00104D46E8|nr:MerC domain-containing protein [Pseudocnuella soli]